MTTQDFIDFYKMQPHPEGGYYLEAYRSNLFIDGETFDSSMNGKRNLSTAIYFLLEQGNFSAFHKIKSDELWHFYAGEALHIYVLHPNGELSITALGNNIANGEVFQYTVPANCWFASKPAPKSSFSFVGCTVAPGFDFTDFELAIKENLVQQFPQHSTIINQLCRQ
jgi:uncharacterized protein